MVSRIMLSLRKLADPRRGNWSLADPAGNIPSLKSMQFVPHPRSTIGGQGETQLDNMSRGAGVDGNHAEVGIP